MSRAVIVTCEHGGNRIPRRYARAFRGKDALLATHRGWDIGAARVAVEVADRVGAPLFVATTSRLVVDLNRSVSHPKLFSDVTRAFTVDERRRILDEHYVPHRAAVEHAVARGRAGGHSVVHLAIHSFTPALDGDVRRADIGLLYDPSHRAERSVCDALHLALASLAPDLVVRRNYPYLGISDSFPTALRRAYTRYAGIEIEFNQKRLASAGDARRMASLLAEAFASIDRG